MHVDSGNYQDASARLPSRQYLWMGSVRHFDAMGNRAAWHKGLHLVIDATYAAVSSTTAAP